MTGGYFSSPSPTLDPSLFDGGRLRPEVRSWVSKSALGLLQAYGLQNARRWAKVWFAGSGASYQWGNGDMDILMASDLGKLVKSNPQYGGVDERAIADDINAWAKANALTHTAVSFGSSQYDATFYWNSSVGLDISRIDPYAAYDVLADKWVVRPPADPPIPTELNSHEWYVAADLDRQRATDIKERHERFSRALKRYQPGSPGYHNAGVSLNLAAAQADALFTDIHGGRARAFSEQGQGYRDYANFRWQRAKATGVIKDLHKIVMQSRKTQKEKDTELYGAPISSAEDVLRRAELWKSGRL